MDDTERFELIGTYKTPRCKVGGWLTCKFRGKVKVHGFTDATIPWPYTQPDRGGGHMTIMCGDLVKALRRESNLAVQHWFGFGLTTVCRWKKKLGIQRGTEGTVHLQRRVGKEAADATRGKPLSAETRQRMCEAQRKRVRPPRGSSFDPAVVALLGKMTDREVAERTGLLKVTVQARRRVLKIAAFKPHRAVDRSFVWTDEKDALLGTMPDNDLATRWGVTLMKIFYRRRKLGIASFRSNH